MSAVAEVLEATALISCLRGPQSTGTRKIYFLITLKVFVVAVVVSVIK
jgi:hypothetical protein